jgi:hypothetical protein
VERLVSELNRKFAKREEAVPLWTGCNRRVIQQPKLQEKHHVVILILLSIGHGWGQATQASNAGQ